MPIVDYNQCKHVMKNFLDLFVESICAGYEEGGIDSCQVSCRYTHSTCDIFSTCDNYSTCDILSNM